MFYGLSKKIKNILPKQLFYRGLLIVAAPLILLQITISIVFFDSLWIKTNKGMTRALVNEIKFFINAYENDQYNRDSLTKLFSDNHDVKVIYVPEKILPKGDQERWFSPMDRTLRRELKLKKFTYWFDTTKFKDSIDLKIKYFDGYFQFLVPKERVTGTSARIFALWITLPAILIISIAIIFLKNQTRPIIKLAEASERFGKGEDVEDYNPSGALEIRKAGFEFERMRKRILRHLNQRSEMLSGISHDLRTPLTRIKLQLEFIKDKHIAKKLADDVDEMEKMLSEYLQFASSTAQEKNENFDLSSLILSTVNKYENKNITVNIMPGIFLTGRKILIQRCINNFISNSIKYANKIEIKVEKLKKNVLIFIDDDGPGIPDSEYENVFKPFYKIDKARGKINSSVGLGLSISSDIVKSHGGKIEFAKSKLGGLNAKISLPF